MSRQLTVKCPDTCERRCVRNGKSPRASSYAYSVYEFIMYIPYEYPLEANIHTEVRLYMCIHPWVAPVKIAPRSSPKGGHHQHLRPDLSPYVL